jgi:hypothetical protein
MTRFCTNPDCGRGFVDAKPARPGVTPPTLCPTCRAKLGRAPLSRLVGGKMPAEIEKEGA